MPEQTLKEKTAKGLFWGGVSNGAQQILGLIFGIVLARLLNASDYGMVGMLAIFTAIASTIQESGFTSALTNRKEIRHEDYNAVFWFSVLTGLFFYVVLFLCAPLIAKFYDKPELTNLSRIVFLGFLFGGFGIASNAYLFKTMMVKERAKIDVISLVVSGIVGITLALNGYAYTGLAIQTTIYIGVGTLLKFHYAPWRPTFRFNIGQLKGMFGFSSKLVITNVFTQISSNVFSVILGKFYNETQLGFYSQGQKWMGMGNSLIGGMINGIAQPVLVQSIEDKERQRNVFRKMVRFGAFVSFPMMLGLAFVAKEFILVFLGEKWSPSIPFLQLFCLWGAIWYLQPLYINLLISHGKSNMYLYGMVVTSLLQILFVFCVFSFGIYFMVVSFIIANVIGLLLWHFLANKIFFLSIFSIAKDIIPYLLSILIAIALCHFVLINVFNLYYLLLFKTIITGGIYLIIMRLGNSVIFKECLFFLFRK